MKRNVLSYIFNRFWGLQYIPRLFSEYMLTFRVEEPMKICMASLHLFQEHICYIFIFILIIKNTQWYKETYNIRTCGETDIYPVDVFIAC